MKRGRVGDTAPFAMVQIRTTVRRNADIERTKPERIEILSKKRYDKNNTKRASCFSKDGNGVKNGFQIYVRSRYFICSFIVH